MTSRFLPGSGAAPAVGRRRRFRYPEEPEVSYIKRLVGLPGETIRIVHGDIFIKPPGGDTYSLARKPLRHQAAMQIAVYDDRCQPKALAGDPKWQRWNSDNGSWKPVEPAVSRYQSAVSKDEWSELRYRHLVPEPDQWDAVLNDHALPRDPRATLVTDFYSYNTNMLARSSDLLDEVQRDQEGAWMQPHWVGDLSLQGNLEVQTAGPGASVRLELVKGGLAHRCTINLTNGTASVTRGDRELGRWETPIKGPGRYRIDFANVDDRVLHSLTVDGRPAGGDGLEYESGDSIPIPTEADLSPAAIATRNAVVVANDLVLKRDIYYTQYPGRLDYGVVWDQHYPRNPTELFDFLSDPSRFAGLANVRSSEYEIGPDRFFMMGDNSPRSKDSRGWSMEDYAWDTSERKSWEVPRQLITGKAFYVYWPHGVPFGPDIRLNHDTRIIFRPYFERMKWIR